jgi:hypothetical protein
MSSFVFIMWRQFVCMSFVFLADVGCVLNCLLFWVLVLNCKVDLVATASVGAIRKYWKFDFIGSVVYR